MIKENKINYEELKEITVTSQTELDMIPDGFKGIIYIKSGVVSLTRVFHRRVVACGNSYVIACGNTSVEAFENACVEAFENACVEAFENASVKAFENTCVIARGNTSVEAFENACVIARGHVRVKAWGNTSIKTWGNTSVEAFENASVEARGNVGVIARRHACVKAFENASVEAFENASVEACGNTSVEAFENASVKAFGFAYVEAWGNVRVEAGSSIARIQIFGNARIVNYPKNIEDFMNFYGIKNDKKIAIFYKAVHRREINSPKNLALIPNDEVAGKPPVEYRFVSDYASSFEYPIGLIVSAQCDPDVSNDCSYGIHISNLEFALSFGREWDDMAIIEVETKIKDIVLPINANGKVRTSEVKILREVPLEECGVFGKILARRRNK